MAEFNNMTITNAGQLLYAKAQGGVQLQFTKMQIGSGSIGTQNPQTLTALITPAYDVSIQSISTNTEAKTATISGMFSNTNVTSGAYICEIGLFAQDPDNGEILYAYGSAGTYGDYLAPATSGAYSWNYQIIAAVGNASNVTVNLSNLSYDYGLVNSTTTFTYVVGGNQKEINLSIDNLFKMYTTSNSGNVYSVTASSVSTLKDGYPLRIKFNAASTGATSLKINSLAAKPIKDYFGNTVTNIRQNLIANLAYESSSDSFILQGKGGGGNVTADKILSPYTATTDAGQVTGTITSKTSQTYTPGTTNQVISSGQYLSGDQTILGDADLIASNIISTANIFGLQGTATIQTLGGKKFVSGYITAPATGSGLSLTVSGIPEFDFVPSMACIKGSYHDSSTNSTYINVTNLFNGNFNKMFYYNSSATYEWDFVSAGSQSSGTITFPLQGYTHSGTEFYYEIYS